MAQIIILVSALSVIRAWVLELPDMLGFEPLPFKPFNCSTCLSWWVGVILSIVFLNPIYLILYLLNDIYDRKI